MVEFGPNGTVAGSAADACEADYAVGKMFIRYSYDMIVNLNEFEQISTLGEL